MKKPIVVLGIGELGGVFSRAFLKNNYPVYPITRTTNIDELARCIDPELILLCTAEADLQPALASIPEVWKNRVAMMQNELLPRDWQSFGFINPTIISVWFEKKKPADFKVLISSPAFGAKSKILVESLALLDIPAHTLKNKHDLLFELVLKNLYILTTNIAGITLNAGANVGELRDNHLVLMRDIAHEILPLQTALTQENFDEKNLEKAMIKAFEGDLEHKCMGRSAHERLDRVLQLAQEFGLNLPVLQKIKTVF
jgi:hypothetical protein